MPAHQTDVLTERAREITFPQYSLRVIEGADRGKSCVASSEELVVGSEQGNQLVLTDPAVSRHHFRVEATSRGPLLRDLRSTNGTTVAGVEVEAAYLTPGAIIGAGRTRLRFDIERGQVRQPLSTNDDWGHVLGSSPVMRRLFAVLEKLIRTDATVLLEGETGTGKGLIAQTLHQRSARARGPFVVVDCASLAPSLIESELFGHEKGAFTGAAMARSGAFETAQGGTVFLDEVGELSLDLQPKLLRVIEERTIKRLGDARPVPLDVRVIAATNRVLHEEVNRGTFRSDLFYRLNVARLRVPALRERAEDLPLLIAHFHRELAGGAEPSRELLERLSLRAWPGNVRELRNAVERAVLLGDAGAWDLEEERADDPAVAPLVPPAGSALPFRVAKERAVAQWERRFVADLLRRHDGNISASARFARMDRNYLRELMTRHHLTGREE